jgi:hypothetical protein
MTLPNDIARCPGWGDGPEDWLDECHDCQRRTAPPGEQWMDPTVSALPPQIITFFCEYYISPDRPEDQRLQELAKQQGVTP